jgi:hypothetical protein
VVETNYNSKMEGWCSKEVVGLSEWECENIYKEGWKFFEFS